MRPNAFSLTRLATLFYFAVAGAAFVWAWIFDLPLLGDERPTLQGLGLGVLTGGAVVLVCHLAWQVSEHVREASAFMGRLFGPVTLPQAVWLAAVSGLAEELCFRGALWPQLGLVGTSVFFALCHVVPVRALAGYPIFAFFAGLLLGHLRLRTGSVWPPVLAHTTINALNIAWLGAIERRRLRPAPLPAPPPPSADRSDLELPAQLEVDESYPLTVWRYDLRLELTGTDRETLAECLEHEELALFAFVPRETVAAELRGGLFVFARDFAGPFAAFPSDLAALSAYLFQPVTGLEVAERYSDERTTDDVRAWKIVAQRGEWVKVPLVVGPPEDGRFIVDPGHEDVDVLAAHWKEYPRWFQDGMRFKYPSLREL